MIELVVIGGSAGALEALLALIPALPPEFEPPIAVALHLGANNRNLIPEILRGVTDRRAFEAEDKMPLRPNEIYIAPPNYHLLIERTRSLALSVDDVVNYSRPSIDVLFESAADAYGARCAGIVLSGANDDGARGLARIVMHGGKAFVQAPVTASQTAMPIAAMSKVGDRAQVMSIPDLANALARLPAATYREGHA
ncbi:MAG: chemotaxis protein CheB [Kofleriaceae bacterium]